MIKSSITKREYQEIYRLLDKVSPLDFDCGSLCSAACCTVEKQGSSDQESEMGIYLLPGEDKIHDKKDPWLSWTEEDTDDYDFPESWNGKVFFVRCNGPNNCKRDLRPMQCRTFPLVPHIDDDGELSLIYNDMELPYNCPLIYDEMPLNDDFVQATFTAWQHLIQDPLIYDLVKLDSEARESALEELRSIRIMFYGDSNTFGYDSQAIFGGRYPEEIRWTDIVAKNLNIEVIPRGMNGRQIPNSEYELDLLERSIKATDHLDYFAIMLGTNDILLTDRPDPYRTAGKMRDLIERLTSKGTSKAKSEVISEVKYDIKSEVISGVSPAIILIIPPLMFPGSENGSQYRIYEDASKTLASEYKKIAKEYDLISIDASKWNVELDYDGVHISRTGSLEFAEHMTDALKELLQL